MISLGHACREETFRLPWALIRLVLHRGDPDLGAISTDDVEEMRRAIRNLDQIPGIDQIIAPERMSTIKRARRTSAFRVGMVLFHVGIVDTRPPRLEAAPPPSLSSKPRISAVMERFLAERRWSCGPSP